MLVDYRELARILSVKPSTIRKWTLEKSIPYLKLGHRCVRFEPETVLKHFRKNEKNVTEI